MRPTNYFTANTFSETADFIQRLCDSYSTITDNRFISSDGALSIEHFKTVHEDCMKEGCAYSFYMGIRERGVESKENLQAVFDRIKLLNDKDLCIIQIKFEDDIFTIAWHPREFKF